jgi:predicted exporter
VANNKTQQPNSMSRAGSDAKTFWAGLSLVAILSAALIYIVTTLSITVELGYFLPQPQNLEQKILVQGLGQGPGSRLIFIAWDDAEQSLPAETREKIEAELQASGLFTPLTLSATTASISSMPEPLWDNRYLLADVDLSEDGLRATLNERLGDLALMMDPDFSSLIAADPYLASMAILETLAEPLAKGEGQGANNVQRNSLMLESKAPAFDAAAQQEAIAVIRTSFMQNTGQEPELFGAGVYTAELQATVEKDAAFRSILASVLVAIVLLAFYRRSNAILVSLIPVLCAGIAGTLALTLLYGQIHGITLAFGFTLLGVAIDYPLHFLSHARHMGATKAVETIWPTLRLSATTTFIAYTAISLGGSKGFAQLGIFSAVGIVTALFSVRWLLPLFFGAQTAPQTKPAGNSQKNRLKYNHSFWLPLMAIAAVSFLLYPNAWWQPDLAGLVPVSTERLQRDQQLRKQLGTPEMRYLLGVRGESREAVLTETEQLQPLLEEAQQQGIVEGYLLISRLLPSEERQQQRLTQFAETQDLDLRIKAATRDLPFRHDAFEPFLQDARQLNSEHQLVSQSTWSGTSLENLTKSGLYEIEGQWVTQSLLYGLSDPAALKRLLDKTDGGMLIDLRAASIALVSDYRERTILLVGIGLLVVFALLLWRIGANNRFLWIVGCVSTSLLITIALRLWIYGGLSLFSIMACVLVAGLSLDYGLFYSRTGKQGQDTADSGHAISACAISTCLAFFILYLSPIPVLQDIGFTVFVGVGLNYLLILGSRKTSSD